MRKNNGLIKGKQKDNVNKVKPHSLSSVAVELSSPRKLQEGVKSAGRGDCE
jgi:hypothetical protein